MERVLTIMSCVSKHIPSDSRNTLISDLRNRLLKFDSPPELIAVSVSTLAKVGTSVSSNTATPTSHLPFSYIVFILSICWPVIFWCLLLILLNNLRHLFIFYINFDIDEMLLLETNMGLGVNSFRVIFLCYS